jgi:hypothetical protein
MTEQLLQNNIRKDKGKVLKGDRDHYFVRKCLVVLMQQAVILPYCRFVFVNRKCCSFMVVCNCIGLYWTVNKMILSANFKEVRFTTTCNGTILLKGDNI